MLKNGKALIHCTLKHDDMCDLIGQNQSHVTIFFILELNIPVSRPHPVFQIGEKLEVSIMSVSKGIEF